MVIVIDSADEMLALSDEEIAALFQPVDDEADSEAFVLDGEYYADHFSPDGRAW